MTGPLYGACADPATQAVTDPVAAPVLAAVLQAVVDLYDEFPGTTPPCSWGLVSGAQMAVDRGGYTGLTDAGAPCAGLVTVRLVSVTPLPVPGGGPIRLYAMPYRVGVEVGVWRPSAQPEETGDGLILPALDVVQAEAEAAAVDAAVVRAALLRLADDTDWAFTPGAFLPWGPDGGIVGGVTTGDYEIA